MTYSVQELAGQRLMVGFDGTGLNEDLKFLIDTLKIGGIILFSRNLINPDQIFSLCRSVQEYASICNRPGLFIAIDQEGGAVARLKAPFTQFPGNPFMHGIKDAEKFAKITADELNSVGINMNLAPVMDVIPEGINGVMANRVFGSDPVRVSDLGTTVIQHLQANKILSVAKHFPGIGRTILDSHIKMPILNTDLQTLESLDLIPFRAAMEHKVSGIMLSHILYEQIDSKWPASLSKIIAKDLLRVQMGYNGIIMTDDLDMGALKQFDIKTVIQRILCADIDIALICHKGPAIENAFNEIIAAFNRYPELKEKGVKSFERIMTLKKHISL